MSEDNRNLMFEGLYAYIKDDKQYSEERFTIHQDPNENHYYYNADILTRAPNGEMYKINSNLIISKKWEPEKIIVSKSLGAKYVTEVFEVQGDCIHYTFVSKDVEKTFEVPTYGQQYYISTPDICSSLLFINMKKFNTTGINSYPLYYSSNDWIYQNAISSQNIYIVRQGHVNGESVTIQKKSVTCTMYQAFTEDRTSNESQRKTIEGQDEDTEAVPVNYYLSKYLTIPYCVEFTEDNLRVEIMELKDKRPTDVKI